MADAPSATSANSRSEPSPGTSQAQQPKEKSAKQLARMCRRALETCVEKLSDTRLFKDCLIVVKHTDNRVENYAASNGMRAFINKRKNLEPIISAMDHKLAQEEVDDIISFFGKPPSPQPAFRMLNAKAVSNLLRAMDFEALKCVDEENRPSHIHYFQGKYIQLGKYLDEDQHGIVDGKFLGKNKKDGRFKSQEFAERDLCLKESWKDGECPEDGAHITFEELIEKPIAKMTRPMTVAATYLHLEWVHEGESLVRSSELIRIFREISLCARPCMILA